MKEKGRRSPAFLLFGVRLYKPGPLDGCAGEHRHGGLARPPHLIPVTAIGFYTLSGIKT
jgi:hypothetical protein